MADESTVLQVKLLNKDSEIPTAGTTYSAGLDLHAAEGTCIIGKGHASIKTGIAIRLPKGCYGRIAPRSGLALWKKVDVMAGVIDPDYTGEISVILLNHADVTLNVRKGDRIAQLICEQFKMPSIRVVDQLEPTDRADCGFGSTGIVMKTTKKRPAVDDADEKQMKRKKRGMAGIDPSFIPWVPDEDEATDSETFELYKLLFAKSVDLKIRELWSMSGECTACCVRWLLGSSGDRILGSSGELECQHTRTEMVNRHMDEAAECQQLWHLEGITNIAKREKLPVPCKVALDEFAFYCRYPLREQIRSMIISGYAGVKKGWLEYFPA